MGKSVGSAGGNVSDGKEAYCDTFPGVDYVNHKTLEAKYHFMASDSLVVRTGAWFGLRVVNLLSIPMNLLAFAVALIMLPGDACCGKGLERIKNAGKNIGQTICDLPIVFELRMLYSKIQHSRILSAARQTDFSRQSQAV